MAACRYCKTAGMFPGVLTGQHRSGAAGCLGKREASNRRTQLLALTRATSELANERRSEAGWLIDWQDSDRSGDGD